MFNKKEDKEDIISVWKERGDRYAAHNDSLQEMVLNLHKLNIELLKHDLFKENADKLQGYKEAIEKLIQIKGIK